MTIGTSRLAALIAIQLVVVPAATAAADAPSTPTLQGSVGAGLFGPGRLAETPSGQILAIDAVGRLHLLTKRGDRLATLLEGVRSVAAGGGRIFAGGRTGDLVVLDGVFGRVLARHDLGVAEGPTGLSYDGGTGLVWMVFASGMVQARAVDGSVAVQLGPSAGTAPYGLVDVAVDSQAGVVWVARDRESPGGMILGLDATTGARVAAVGASGSGPAKATGALRVGADGHLYVSDMVGNTVKVVTTGDSAVRTIGLSDAGQPLLSQPLGLAFMQNGDLLVASVFSSRLERYGDGSPLPTCEGDADCDGMSDAWERANGLDPQVASDAFGDVEGDGLTNLEEFALGSDPGLPDTDGDGEPDAVEVANGTDPLARPNVRPVLVASRVTEFVPGVVRLQAAVTGIADASGCSASWRQGAGEPVSLAGASTLSPTFVARRAGAFRFTAVATCAGVASDAVEVAANVVNVPPLAPLARTLVVPVGKRVEIGATGAGDANGDSLRFSWEQVGGPASAGPASGPLMAATLRSEGAHRYAVTATDPAGASAASETTVVALGRREVAAAAVVSPVVGEVGRSVALDASGSFREGGASFTWRQVEGPTVRIVNGDLPLAGFVPPKPGRYGFEVTIGGKGVTSPPGRVDAYVAAAGRALPVLAAAAPSVAAVGGEVTLDGSSSSGGDLQYRWRQVTGPATAVAGSDRAIASVYLFEPGAYEFELSAANGAGPGLPARVRVEAREEGAPVPQARVSAPATAVVGEGVVLDGTASAAAVGYRWSQVAGPWVLLGAEPAVTFTPRAPGTYVFELEVDDGRVRSAPARVSVVVTGDGMGN